MNWQNVLNFFKTRIIENGQTSLSASDIAVPNTPFEAGARLLWLELSISPNGYHGLTEVLSLYPAHLNIVIAVPKGTGSERMNETARRLADLFSPQAPDRCGWNIDNDTLVHIRKVEQMPATLSNNVCRTNLRVSMNIYEQVIITQNNNITPESNEE